MSYKTFEQIILQIVRCMVGVSKFENINPSSAIYTFIPSINLAWMDDKYKDVESKYESRDI